MSVGTVSWTGTRDVCDDLDGALQELDKGQVVQIRLISQISTLYSECCIAEAARRRVLAVSNHQLLIRSACCLHSACAQRMLTDPYKVALACKWS